MGYYEKKRGNLASFIPEGINKIINKNVREQITATNEEEFSSKRR